MDYVNDRETPLSSNYASGRSDRANARRKIPEMNQGDHMERRSVDDQSSMSGGGIATVSSLSTFSTQDDVSAPGSNRRNRSHRGVDNSARSGMYSTAGKRRRGSESTLHSVSTTRSDAVLLEMSLDDSEIDEPADFGLVSPVVSVGNERKQTTNNASIGARITDIVFNRDLPSSGKDSLNARASHDEPTPGAYHIRGRAIGAIPAWVRQNGQQLFNRHASNNSLQSRRVERSSSSRSTGTIERILQLTRPAAARQAPARSPDSVENGTSTDPELLGPMLPQQAVELENDEFSRERKDGFIRIVYVVLSLLIFAGVATAVTAAILATGRSKNPIANDAGNSPPPSLSPVAPIASMAPTNCSQDFDRLSSAHRVCLCSGDFNDWEEFEKVIYTVENVLLADPTMNSMLDSLGLTETRPYSCSPNDLALFWLAEDFNAHGSPNETWVQRFLLASLFMIWTELNPFRWRISTNWLSAKPECSWSGIRCNEAGQVEVIRLSQNNLASSAELPIEIFMLSTLTSLDISFNNMHFASIPSEISKLSELKILNLRSNQIDGVLPFDLFPKSLVEVRLESTNMNTEIPSSVRYLFNVEILEMNNANVIGTIPSELGTLTKLRELYLGGNSKLQGGIPTEIGGMLALNHIDMHSNIGMEIRLVSEIGLLSNLVILNLNGANGIGSIPTEIGLLVNLAELGLQGIIEASSESMYSSRGFSGLIPQEIGKLSRLEFLNIGENILSGQIPSEIGELSQMMYCDLGMNLLTGTLPSELAALSKLRLLRLRGNAEKGSERNSIMGKFPSTLGNLSNLDCIDVSGTLLTGSVPDSLCLNHSTPVFINLRCVGVTCSCCSCDAEDQCIFRMRP